MVLMDPNNITTLAPPITDEATVLLKELLINEEKSLRAKVETCSLLLENGGDANAVYEETGQSLLHITTRTVQTIEVLKYKL